MQQLPLTDRDKIAADLARISGRDPSDAGMRSDDIAALAAASHEVGFHTLRHAYLRNLSDDSLADALIEGRDRIAALSGAPLTTIAYPHGGVDQRVAAAARDAGFSYGFCMRAEAVRPGDDPLLIGRIVPSFNSTGHLAARLVYALAKS